MVSASLTNFSPRWQWWLEEEAVKLLGSKSLVWDCPVFSLGGLQACSADHGWETLLSVDSGSLHGSSELEACPRGPALPWSERHHRHAGQLPAALRGKWPKGILKATWGIQTQRWSPRDKADVRGARRLVLGQVESLEGVWQAATWVGGWESHTRHPRVTIGMSFLPKVEQLDKMVTEKAGFKR